jgi:hypothetical protein
MPQAMGAWPEVFDVESEPYAGLWSLVRGPDAGALDRKIRARGWSYFFIAAEAKAMFVGAPREEKIHAAVRRVLGKVKEQHYNSLEVTGIVTKRFLGIPYTVVSAHPRHLQHNCYLDTAGTRRSLMADQNWISPSRMLLHSSGENGASLPAVEG